MPTYRFQGRVDKLEIARGYDGLLRGPPDPVLAIGVYVHDTSTFRLFGRSLHRFQPRGRMPLSVAADVDTVAHSAIETSRAFRYVALAIALEEDGGRDVQRLYGMLEHHRLLTVCDTSHREVEPYAIVGLPRDRAWSTPTPVELIVDGVRASASCESDKLIGAACWTMEPRAVVPTAPARASVYRLPFLSSDRRNDWTAVLDVIH